MLCYLYKSLYKKCPKNHVFAKHKKNNDLTCLKKDTLVYLKSDPYLPKNICVICINESPSKMMKNAFYFILKALLVLKIFMFLSRLFGHLGKTD